MWIPNLARSSSWKTQSCPKTLKSHRKCYMVRNTCLISPGTSNCNIYPHLWYIFWIGVLSRTIEYQNGVGGTSGSILSLIQALKNSENWYIARITCLGRPGTYSFNVNPHLLYIFWIGVMSRTIWHHNGVLGTSGSILSLIRACKIRHLWHTYAKYRQSAYFLTKLLIWDIFYGLNWSTFVKISKIMSKSAIFHIFGVRSDLEFLGQIEQKTFTGLNLFWKHVQAWFMHESVEWDLLVI